MPTDFAALLKALAQANADFVVVGGMAAVSHGSSFVTADLDVCYSRRPDNLDAVAAALQPFHPRLRGPHEPLPFRLDARTLTAGLNFTLVTDAGDFDLLGELIGGAGIEDLRPASIRMDIGGTRVLVMGLDDLIRSKEATGREKDLLHAKELRRLRDLSKPEPA